MEKKELLKILESELDNDDKAEAILDLITPTSEDIDFENLRVWFNKVTGKNIRAINKATRNHLRARLREGYTKKDIATAIKNCINNDFHRQNPQYLTLEFISRPDKFERYLFANTVRIPLPEDWYNRELTEHQKSLLTPEQRKSWEKNKKAVEMAGDKLKPIRL